MVAGLLLAWPGALLGESTNSVEPILSLTLNEHYDSNVMLQDAGAQAGQESFVTSLAPVLGAKADGDGKVSYSTDLAYAPDYSFFHNLSRESYLRHVGVFNLDARTGNFRTDMAVRAQYTDGTTDPPVWGQAANGDQVPAMGATEVRSRRRNMFFLSKLSGRQDIGRSYVRGVFDARIWDFMTEDTFVPGVVIQNYYDRTDINGGVDLGFEVKSAVEPFVGYRLGHQDQEYRANAPLYNYANTYHRFFVGLAAQPSASVRFRGEIGPSVHLFDASTVPPGTDTVKDYLYFKAAMTVKVSTNTFIELAGGQYLLPSSAGEGVFQNLYASGQVTHRFASRWQGSVGIEFSEYDFDATFQRRDQLFVPELRLQYRFNKHFEAWLSYAFEAGRNTLDVPNGSKRDYDRHLLGITLSAAL